MLAGLKLLLGLGVEDEAVEDVFFFVVQLQAHVDVVQVEFADRLSLLLFLVLVVVDAEQLAVFVLQPLAKQPQNGLDVLVSLNSC